MTMGSVAPPPSPLRQLDYALLALYRLGGADRLVDIEDIAVEAFKLAPELFRWRNYSEYPSTEAVRTAFRDAQRRGRNVVVSGAGGRARRLSALGLTEARVAETRSAQHGAGKDGHLRRPVNRELTRMEGHPALEKWRRGGIGAVTRYDLADLLRCSPSATRSVFEARLRSAETVAVDWDRDELRRFLSEAFADDVIGRESR